MIRRILENTLELHQSSDDYRKGYFLVTTLLVLIVILSFFIYYNIFIKPLYSVALLDGSMLLFSIACFYLLIKKKNIEASATFLTSILFVLTLLFILDQKNRDFALVYGVIFPIATIYLKGINRGLLFLGLYFSAVLSVSYLGIGAWEAAEYTLTAFVNLATVYFVVILLVIYYEKSRLESSKAMHELNRELETLSTTDHLTGLNNRRYINKIIFTLYEQAKSENKPFSLLLLDIDDFKLINDTYGHTKGDEVLKEFSNILKKHTRAEDTVGRWGGEEFLILCTNTTISQANTLAQKILTEISKGTFNIQRVVSASIGVTEFRGNCTFEELISRVDTAMYTAKKSGKNKIVSV